MPKTESGVRKGEGAPRKSSRFIRGRLHRPIRRVTRDDQSWFFHPEMQARIAEAEADFLTGRSYRADTPEAEQALLDSWK